VTSACTTGSSNAAREASGASSPRNSCTTWTGLPRLGTFQKLYTQDELREYLQGVLEAEAVPAAPGVFYVFKDDELRQPAATRN
jgi:hypothetical protein